MTQTLESFVRATHPHRLVEPLDTTTPTHLLLEGPTVIIEVMGAREALDTLARVHRLVDPAPIAAVRLAATDPARDRRRATASDTPGAVHARSGTATAMRALVAAAAVVVCVVAVVRLVRLVGDVAGTDVTSEGASTRFDTMLLVVGAAVLAVIVAGAVRGRRRERRLPVERRRYRERRRDSAVIAVPATDERTAAALAGAIRRAMGDATPAGTPCDVSVHRPPHHRAPDADLGE